MVKPDDYILIVAPDEDIHALAVKRALELVHGRRVLLLDTSKFPTSYAGSVRIDSAGYESTLGIIKSGASIKSVWWRRPQPCALNQANFRSHRDYAQAECEHFVQGLLWQHDCLWVNDPMRNTYASRKIVQLSNALRAGLNVPRTLCTNDPRAAREFVSRALRPVILKRIATVPGPFSKTAFVTSEILSQLDTALPSCPATFQEYIEGCGDVRVTWIDDIPFAILIESQKGAFPEDSRIDVNVPHIPYQLDGGTESAIRTFMQTLGLRFGALDFRLCKDGILYFLEVNPAGQFAFVEVMTGMQLISAMARLLSAT